MQIKKWYWGMAVFAAAVSMTACGGQRDVTEPAAESRAADAAENVEMEAGPKDRNVPMGRYRETEIKFPQKVKTLFEMKTKEDGTIQVLFENEPGSLYLYESNDNGADWESRMEAAAGALPNGYRAADACMRPDGKIFVSVGRMSEEPVFDRRAEGPFSYYNLNPADGDAQAEEVFFDLTEAEGMYGDALYGFRNIAVSEDGLFYGMLQVDEGEATVSTELTCIRLEDGITQWSKKTGYASYSLKEDVLYINEHEKTDANDGYIVKILDAKTGDQTGEMKLPKDCSLIECVDFRPEEKRTFYCTQDGIFSSDYELTLNETLVSGDGNSISESGYLVKGFLALKDNAFLVDMQAYMQGETKIYRYEYDPTIPAVPDRKITVYSLKDNDTAKKMVFDFCKEHPEIGVEYEVGMQENGVSTVSDAIHILNTEMMAGNGPDVLVLNSLPWESYSEKGILLDVGAEISAKLEAGELYENMVKTYQRDGSWYAVPVSFKVPAIAGKEDRLSSIDSLESLGTAAAKTGEILPFARTDQELLRYLSSVYWNTIQGANGEISGKNLRTLLEQVKRMNDTLNGYGEAGGMEYGSEDVINNFYDIFAQDTMLSGGAVSEGWQAFDLGYMSDVLSYACLCNDSGAALKALNEGVFSPLLAGINGKSRDVEAAKLFLEYILSEKEQQIFGPAAYPLMDNFPVNKKAFQNIIQKPTEEELYELGKPYRLQGLEFNWPEQGDFDCMNTIFEGLTIPAMEDSLIIQTVLDSGMPYLKGETDLDTAVNELSRKLELNFAE